MRANYFPHTQASHSYVCEHHRAFLHSMRAKRKRKDSEEENDYQPEVRDGRCLGQVPFCSFSLTA